MATHALLYKCPFCGTPQEVEPHREGEVITCTSPACGKPFQLDLPVAHPVAPPAEENHGLIVPEQSAPATGSLIVPEPTAAPGEAQLAAEAQPVPPTATPLGEEILPDATEKTILMERPAMFRRFPGRFLLYLAMIAGGVALFIYAYLDAVNLWFFEVAGAALAAYGAFYLFSWWARIHSTSVTVTNHRTLVVQGLLNKQTVEIAHKDLDHLEVHQTVFQRLLGVGDLDIYTGEGRKNVAIMALPRAQWVANQIRAQHPAVRETAPEQAAAPSAAVATAAAHPGS